MRSTAVCKASPIPTASNIGNTVEPYAYSMQGIDPKLIGINLAIGHVATGAPGTAWQIMMRRWMPYIGCVAPEDIGGTINATTGALSVGRVAPGPGLINWTTFYSLLRLGGYSGAAENQLEYTITGGTGTSVSLNNAAFADSCPIHERPADAGDHDRRVQEELRRHPVAGARRWLDGGADPLSLGAGGAPPRRATRDERARASRRAPVFF